MTDNIRYLQIRAEMDKLKEESITPLSNKLKKLKRRQIILENRYRIASAARESEQKTRIIRALTEVDSKIFMAAVNMAHHTIRYGELQEELSGNPHRIAQVA